MRTVCVARHACSIVIVELGLARRGWFRAGGHEPQDPGPPWLTLDLGAERALPLSVLPLPTRRIESDVSRVLQVSVLTVIVA
jgi:hypothetical protein